jgi:hypothetical protein
MSVNKTKVINKNKVSSKLIKVVLFWTIFLFVVFMSKKIIGHPKGTVDFLVKNLLSLACALIVTGTMLHFFSQRALKISILILWIIIAFLIIG